MKKGKILFGVVLFVLGFLAGEYWNKISYQDICLDIGGGKNPGNYPICVLDKSKKNKEKFVVKKYNPENKVLVKRLEKMGIKVEKNETGVWESIFSTYEKDGENFQEPIKNLSVEDRKYFAEKILKLAEGNDKDLILTIFRGLKNDDFKNTGNLEYQVDFDILLNNYLRRLGLEPANGEDLEKILEEMKVSE